MIYFIENSGLIKIGYAKDVANRLASFRTAIPSFAIIATMEGTRGHERTIHDCLSIHRQKGEWFTDCAEVRTFIAEAVRDGVKEWKAPRSQNYTPSMWDDRARKLSEIIFAGRLSSDLKEIENEYSIPKGALWNLKYRPSREVSAGEFFALLSAARECLKRQRDRLEKSESFVADLEREDAETTNSVITAERKLNAVRAEVS